VLGELSLDEVGQPVTLPVYWTSMITPRPCSGWKLIGMLSISKTQQETHTEGVIEGIYSKTLSVRPLLGKHLFPQH